MSKITIYNDGVWAGTGTLNDDGNIEDCSAVLGPDQDASDDTYEAIEDAIKADGDAIDGPDGQYTWDIE